MNDISKENKAKVRDIHIGGVFPGDYGVKPGHCMLIGDTGVT